jgi:tRNA threonylcarbamoyladenosine modification (KEOPS) complex  Pcc1 subunit
VCFRLTSIRQTEIGSSSNNKSKVQSANLNLEIKASNKLIDAIQAAMTIETQASERCRMSLRRSKRNLGTLTMQLNAGDLVSLRASLNTNIRLISASISSIQAAEKDSITKHKLQKHSINQS